MTLTPEQEAILRDLIEERASWIKQAEDQVTRAHPWRGWGMIIDRQTPTRDALSAALTEINELRERQARVDELVEAARECKRLRFATVAMQDTTFARLTRALAPFDEEGT